MGGGGVGVGCYLALLTTVGQTFLSAREISTITADRNVCPTEHFVVDWPRVVRNAGYFAAGAAAGRIVCLTGHDARCGLWYSPIFSSGIRWKPSLKAGESSLSWKFPCSASTNRGS